VEVEVKLYAVLVIPLVGQVTVGVVGGLLAETAVRLNEIV